MNRYFQIVVAVLTLAFAAGNAPTSSAASVRVGLSARETYVGLPVVLRIQVANATKVEAPAPPTIDGVTIKSLGNPSRSTQITTINGNTTTTTTQVFAFEVTPQRSGTFQIPAIAVNADGYTQQTHPVEFVATKSETGDLMFVEIAGKEKQIYVGQALHLTLKIWLRPYTDSARKITLSEGDMWKMISDRSDWGPFAERMQLYADQNRRPSGKEVLRKDRDGVEHSYYLYEIEATIYPKRPGKIDGDNVKLIADYPTAIGKARDPFAGFFDDTPFSGVRPPGFGDDDDFSLFGAHLVVQSMRPVAGQAVVEPIEVLPIPTADRPADYRGAVGTYHIAVDANPTHVKAGDPINLYIGIAGTGPMELVQAPPLAEVPELSADFKVPSEPLAGFVKGDRKIFQTTIRPRKQGITKIPPIPFSYFDPATAKFVTVHSEPISIQVDKAEMLALDGATHGAADKAAALRDSRSTPERSTLSSLSISDNDDILVNEAPRSPNWALWTVLFAVPPFAVLLSAIARNRLGLSRLGGWFNSANAQLRKELAASESMSQIAGSLKRFAARHYKVRGATPDPESIIGAMRAAGARDLAVRFETLLHDCDDDLRFARPVMLPSLDDLKSRSQQWANDVQSSSRRAVPKPNPRAATGTSAVGRSAAKPSATLLLAITMTIFACGAGNATAAEGSDNTLESLSRAHSQVTLNEQQRKQLLSEASSAYSKAREQQGHDNTAARSGFQTSAEKYQVLVDSGITNSQLYFNLANAYLESGQADKAIVNYRRSLRIRPTFRDAQTNLALAESQLHPPTSESAKQPAHDSSVSYSKIVSHWLIQHVTPSQVLTALALAWVAFWTVIGFRLLNYPLPWKSSAVALAIVMTFLAVTLIQIWPTSAEQFAVVLHSDPANSNSNALQVIEGQTVEVLQQRRDTVRIRTPEGQEMWLPAEAVEVI